MRRRWLELAACRDHDPELWYPPASHMGPNYSQARRICMSCPVIDSCLSDALASESGIGTWSIHGMRGGLTPQQRARVLRERAS